jgi:hypothetical protein
MDRNTRNPSPPVIFGSLVLCLVGLSFDADEPLLQPADFNTSRY